MSYPTISVLIPLYNRRDYVIYAIESVQKQTVQPLEIIVVDDGSTDEGPSLVKEYSQKNGLNILLIRNEANKGVSGSRNTGVCFAKGDYIAYLDSDDVWLPEHLKRLSDCVSRTEAQIVCSDFSFFGIKELCEFNITFFKRLKKRMLKNGFEQLGEKEFLSDHRLLEAALTGGFSLRIQGSLIHKSVFWDSNVWFDEKLSFLEDHQFYLEAAYKRVSMAYSDEIGVMIRKFRDDTHYDKIESHRYRMEKMMKMFDCRTMNAKEQDVFHRAIHEMGFILIRGELLKEEVIKSDTKQPRKLSQRIIESLNFLYHFPTNRGFREAIKNIIGDLPSRFLVCLIKRTPFNMADFQYIQNPSLEESRG
jgi:glycosyltransferase involved in cell wall biosynthesis